MVIDLPASSQTNLRGNQNPVTQISNQRQEALQAALKALNIRAEESVQATVKSVTPADQVLRARLLQLTNPVNTTAETGVNRNLTQNGDPLQNNSRGLPSPQERLLNSTTLKLLEVTIQGKSLLLFTDRPVKTGQQLQVQLHNGSFIDVTGKTGNKPSAAYTTNLSSAATHASVTSAATHQAPPALLSSQQKTVLQTELRALLPDFAPKSAALLLPQVMKNLLEVSKSISAQNPGGSAYTTSASAVHTNAHTNGSLESSLRTLAQQLRTPQQLGTPSELKQALMNSGIQLENSLSRHSGSTNPAKSDLKGALLHALASSGSKTSPLPTAGYTATPEQLASASAQIQQWLQTQPSSLAAQAIPERLVSSLQDLIQIAIQKLLYNQLQSISRTQTRAETGGQQHLQLEIPVRYGTEVHHIPVQLEEEWTQDSTSEENQPQEKTRQWLVKLSFELPDAGALHAHITVVNETVSTSLWAEQKSTFQQLQDSLETLSERLENDGCDVRKIECFEGQPKESSMSLGYSLVDIKT